MEDHRDEFELVSELFRAMFRVSWTEASHARYRELLEQLSQRLTGEALGTVIWILTLASTSKYPTAEDLEASGLEPELISALNSLFRDYCAQVCPEGTVLH